MSEKQSGSGKVLLVGDVMRDIIVKPEGILRKGSDRKAHIEIKPGGSAANQAVWLAANSVAAKLVARVGAAERPELEKQFRVSNVEPCFIGDPHRGTGVLVSMIDVDGERSFYTDRGANEALCLEDLPENALDGVGLVLLSGYSFFITGPRAVAIQIMARAKRKNIMVGIDPSSAGFIQDVGVKNFLDWTKGATILFPNAEEAALLSGEETPQKQLEVLGAFYDLVVLTRGSEGASLLDRQGKVISVPALAVDIVDTTGAGDAFAAGFLARYMAGASLESCLKNGVEQGARAVTLMGGRPA